MMVNNNQVSTSNLVKSPTPIDLPEIDKLIVNGQPQFGVFKRVNHINYLDYHSHLISQKPVTHWRKQFKANQFAFIQIIHAPYRICMAVATIKLATSAFAYIYHDESGEFEIVEGLSPLTLGTQLEGGHRQGVMSFKSRNLMMSMQFAPEQVGLSLNSDVFEVKATLSRDNNPLAMCSPSGRRGWTFTQKEPFNKVAGTLTFKAKSKHSVNKISDIQDNRRQSDSPKTSSYELATIEFNATTRANLDWTLGFMRHETNWFWACINTKLDDDTSFMLNLSMGVNETGSSENACWIAGKIYYLPPVMFRREAIDERTDRGERSDSQNTSTKDSSLSGSRRENREVWRIRSQQLGWSLVTIDLTFIPITVYQKTDNYGVVASIFEQWIGHYSGTITLPSQDSDSKPKVIYLDKVMGLAEDHFAKW